MIGSNFYLERFSNVRKEDDIIYVIKFIKELKNIINKQRKGISMNVIFLDFDGVLETLHYKSDEDVEKRVKILSDICKKYDCKVVIEAAFKDAIDEKTMQIEDKWVKYIFSLFNKYGIECIGRTPNVRKKYTDSSYMDMWKEDEIRLYLYRHPEIKHYCIIDDDDLQPYNSDLNKVRDYLVQTVFYSINPSEEGLNESHSEMIGEVLKKENKIRKLILKKKNLL